MVKVALFAYYDMFPQILCLFIIMVLMLGLFIKRASTLGLFIITASSSPANSLFVYYNGFNAGLFIIRASMLG